MFHSCRRPLQCLFHLLFVLCCTVHQALSSGIRAVLAQLETSTFVSISLLQSFTPAVSQPNSYRLDQLLCALDVVSNVMNILRLTYPLQLPTSGYHQPPALACCFR
ncbi:hypothetical protein BDR04DRAFT_249398 [Suillus decipiens]|nr:hypothetical protein BDR04DRAFT_249398 [Suillus decipiens]